MLNRTRSIRVSLLCVALALIMSCARAPKPAEPGKAPAPSPLTDILPAPATIERSSASFTAGPGLVIVAPQNEAALGRIATLTAQLIGRATGARPAVTTPDAAPQGSRIVLSVKGTPSSGGPADDAYEMTIGDAEIRIDGASSAGVFYGVQTLRQLLPYASEYEAANFAKPKPAVLPGAHIADRPRFAWRGAMLDVARHFFSVEEVKRYIDLLALYKINRLHLHLADDQGWRIEIKSWPELTARGGRSEVGGGTGGYYTQQQYAELVSYAADRFITVVPEIDMPGHTNAGLSSYAELNCSGRAPEPYTGIEVGFSALCVEKDVTYKFIDDVVREIAGMTPGAYFHAGGDEVKTLTPDQYKQFIERVQTIVQAHGKQMIGWDEIASATLLPTSIVQHWRPEASRAQLAASPRLILSPANRVYLDMKYDEQTVLGLRWAGFVSVQKTYDWDPDKDGGVPPDKIVGIEAPLWTETVATVHDLEFMAFPRIAALADLGWAPAATHDWQAFTLRLGAQAPRWTALGVNFYRAPEIQWRGVR
jgi:hexosaminidase